MPSYVRRAARTTEPSTSTVQRERRGGLTPTSDSITTEDLAKRVVGLELENSADTIDNAAHEYDEDPIFRFTSGVIVGTGVGSGDEDYDPVFDDDTLEEFDNGTASYITGDRLYRELVPDDEAAPGTVTGLTATAGVRSIILNWTGNAEVDMVDGYGTYYLEVNTDSGFDAGSVVYEGGVGVTFPTVNGLTTGTTYYARVKAKDAHGNESAFTSGVSAVPASVNAADITANTITAGQIASTTITAAELAADSVTAAKLAAFTMEAGKYIRSTNYDGTDYDTNDATAGWNIESTGGKAEFGLLRARGYFETAASGARAVVDSDSVDWYTSPTYGSQTTAGYIKQDEETFYISGFTSESHIKTEVTSGALDSNNQSKLKLISESSDNATYGTIPAVARFEGRAVALEGGTYASKLPSVLLEPFPGYYANATGQSYTTGTAHQVNLTSATLIADPWGGADHTNDKWVVPDLWDDLTNERGSFDLVFEVGAWCDFGNNNSASRRALGWSKNGGTVYYFTTHDAAEHGLHREMGHTLITAQPGDSIEWFVWHNHGSTITGAQVRYWCRLLGSVEALAPSQNGF